MSLDRRKQLTAEGYERVKVQAVALPHTVWKLDIDVEFDRPLTLAEETVLTLVDAGVNDPQEITRLMGMDEGVIVPSTVVNLLMRGLLGHVEALMVPPLGKQALGDNRTRQGAKYTDVEVRHDPYSDTFVWQFDVPETKGDRAVRESGYHVLPAPPGLAALDVDTRHAEVQSLLERFGFPFDDPDTRKSKPQRDIVRLRATHGYPAWRAAELEVWFHAEREDWQWYLNYRGGEEHAISRALAELQAEGVELLPLEEREREPPKSAVTDRVQQVAEAARSAPRSQIIQTEQHRAVLEEAVRDARRELIVVSPWLTTAAVDGDLLSWFDHALARVPELKIIVGYGIEPDAGKGDRKARDQREALKRLNGIGQRYRGRLRTIEIGYTHEKVVICDGRYAIITSFNWLSFNPKPGRGVRRETGTRVDDRAAVVQFRDSLADILGLR